MEIKDVKNIDLDLNKNYYNSLMDEEAPHWNKSIQDLIDYYNKHFNKNYNYYENENGKIIDENGKLLNGADIFRLTDIKNSNAGANFSDEKEILDSVRKIAKPWVIPWYNIDEDTYRTVRGSDKDLDALQNQKDLQFTRSILKYKNGNDNRWMRLLMPQYSRFVEVEDLNRNFWVIGQTLSAISAFLFGPEAMIPSLLNNFLDEICQLWENLLFLQSGIEASKQMPYYNKWHFEIVEVPNEEWQAYRKYDNFNNDQLSIHLDYLEKTYTDFNLCILPKVRMNNYEYNYYSKVFYPYFLVLNRNTMQSYQEAPFDLDQNETDLTIGFFGIKFKMNLSEIDFTKIYGIKENDDTYDYGRLDMCRAQENSDEFYSLISNTEEIEYDSIENKVHFKSYFIDKVAEILNNFNPEIGDFDLAFNLSTQEADGCQYTLAVDTIEDTQMKSIEILSGFYQGDLISCPSNIEPEPIRFNIVASTSWTQGEIYSGTITITLTGGGITETRTTSDTSERFLFNNLLAFNGDQKITYTITESLSNSDWSIQMNSYSIQYNDALIEEVEFVNTYTPSPVVPDWPGLVLWADAAVPPENGVWKNQIEETNQDIRLSGSGISANDDEIIFQPGRNFGEYDLPDFATINGAYSFYLIIKSSGVNTFNANSSGFEDMWLRLGNKNAYAAAITGLSFGRNYSQPYINSAAAGLDAYYGYSACSSQYHVYAFTKTNNSTTVKVFLDGVKVKEISVNNVSGFSTPVLIFNRAADDTAINNSNTNYYKLIAYSTQTHNESDVITYSNLLKQRYHISGEIENISFENFVNFTSNCTLNTNYTLLSDKFDFITDFVPSNNGYSTYQNYRGNFVYTDSRDLTSISATGSSAYFEFIIQYNTGAEVSTAQNLNNNYFYTGTYKDRLKINITSSSIFVDLRDAAAGSTYRNYGSVHDTAVTPKDSSIKIFGKSGCGFSGSVYSISLLDNDKIVRTFLPASYTNSGNTTRGLYDIVNGVFYSSSGTDQFSL